MSNIAKKRREITRELIFDTARELFSKKGYHNTQVMDIVKAAGVSAGTFYNYFNDKRDLFEQITINSVENLRLHLKLIREPVDIWDYHDRRKTLLEMYTALFDFVDSHPQQLMMILRGSFGVDKEFDYNSWNYFCNLAHDLAEDTTRWIDQGIIDGVDPFLFGHAAVGMALQVLHSYLMEKDASRKECIKTLIVCNMAMFEAYLTDKGK
ncbi:MAG: TetR/AcrR family transcriptional regulator [Deltaproteobacteria bacterium]|nr:TetR/AcrR family transcriptional regulator [Deltaproteobacteria bacterium]